jgi:hypothetical protein
MDTFNGIPLRGPVSPSTQRSGHARYAYVADDQTPTDGLGALQFDNCPLQLGFVNGRYVSVLVDVPSSLQSANFQKIDTSRYDVGADNVVTVKGSPDTAPDFFQVVRGVGPDHAGFVPGYRMNPATDPEGPHWVTGQNADDTDIYGPAPGGTTGSGGVDALVTTIADALAQFLTTRK